MPTREPTLEDLARTLGMTPANLRRIASSSHQSRSSFLGKIASAISDVLGIGRSRGGRKSYGDLPDEVLEALGGNTDASASDERRIGGRAPGRGGTRPGGGNSPAAPPIQSPPQSQRFPRVSGMNQEPPTEQEQEEWSDEFLVPSSSNVYSYQYFRRAREATGTLYVTFRAANLNSKAISKGTTRKGRSTSRSQLIGKAGKTVTGGARPFEPGPRYAYLKVPPGIFSRIKDSWSKGGAVWDLLRVRGTVWGHKFEYTLVQGQVSPGLGGAYVPRKATAKGFRTRSIADTGSGRRGFVTSTLPPTSAAGGGGFRTRSVAARSRRR